MTIEFASDVFDNLIVKPTPEPSPALATFSDRGVVLDIETGPRPWSEIEQFFAPPESLPPWDDSMVKYGNAKHEALRKDKYDAQKAYYQKKLDGQAADMEAAKAEFLDKAALSPVTGQVLAIGYHDGATKTQPRIDDTITCGGEHQVLLAFWSQYLYYRKQRIPMIGFNIFAFDLPFLVRRSWLHAVDVPRDVLSQGRYWDKIFVDLMLVWGCGVWGERISLDKLCGFFGLSRKTGNGADFARLYNDPATRGEALAYLRNDLKMTAEAAMKLGVL
jgi:hypothetical protein